MDPGLPGRTEPRRLLVVTGMHRSGTSLVASMLDAAGVDFGPEDALIQPREDNPRGFWENLDFLNVSEDVLRAHHGTWSDPPVLEPGWAERPPAADLVAGAQALVEATFGRPEPGRVDAFKDPRVSVLLPFWRQVCDITPVVMVVRDPVDVAGSLEKRGHFGGERAAYLWLRHHADLLCAEPDPVVVPYAAVLRTPEETAARLLDAIGLPPGEGDAQRAARSVEPSLAHGHAPSDGPLMRAAQELHERILTDVEEAVGLARAHARTLRAVAPVDRGLRRGIAGPMSLWPEPLRFRQGHTFRLRTGAVLSSPARRRLRAHVER